MHENSHERWKRVTAMSGQFLASLRILYADHLAGRETSAETWADVRSRIEYVEGPFIPIGDEENGIHRDVLAD